MSLPVESSPGLTLSTSSASDDPNGTGKSHARAAMPAVPRMKMHASSEESGQDVSSPGEGESAHGGNTKYHAIYTASSNSELANCEIAISIAESQSSHGAKTVNYNDQFAAQDEIQENSGQRYAQKVGHDGGDIDIETATCKTVPTMSEGAKNESGDAHTATMSLTADEANIHNTSSTSCTDAVAAALRGASGSNACARAAQCASPYFQ